MITNLWRIFVFLLALPTLAIELDTVSIKGDITLSSNNLDGNFVYTLRNETSKPQQEWTFFIHPNVNILAVGQNNKQAKLEKKQGLNYQIISVKLPQEIAPASRSTLIIRFNISQQTEDPRFTVSSNNVFLDARSFWFPMPVKDTKVNFNLTVKHSLNLISIMGGKKIENANIGEHYSSTWKNELPTLTPSASLIITKKPLYQFDDIYIYSENKQLHKIISNKFAKFWDTAKNKYQKFPLSEIHIIPLKISIPSEPNYEIEGEFIGNIFVVDQSILDTLAETNSYNAWDTPSERLVETLIHELHHSFFPGIVKHNQDHLLFVESLVQYLTWSLIKDTDPIWGQKIGLRTRFYLQNFIFTQKFDDLWKFLWDSVLLYNTSSYANLDSFTLTDTLIAKYQYTEYTPTEVFETIAQHKQQNFLQTNTTIIENIIHTDDDLSVLPSENISPYDTTLFKAFQQNISEHKLFNIAVQAKKTNFQINVTNTSIMKKNRIVSIPVKATFLSISHDYPFAWSGKLIWIEHKITNSLALVIKKNDIWETNLPGKIELIKATSSLDILEKTLSDNYISQNNMGRAIIYGLNESLKNVGNKTLHLSSEAHLKLAHLQKSDLKLAWDSTSQLTKDIWYINAFIIKNKKRIGFVSLPITKNKKKYTIHNILDTK